ncbi:hypothetical protein FKG94_13150 [Exilibacterium tricleocarpae]|uniref:Uncharacterized protein n=1 Tax=Exilibacterium tricleocarpae TaxID=2591008 RepID=A0A545TLC0_9GAMM|nr:hypothetical protein [Exilibacterium tricleocarpae]TQV78024.1 hypothetical protein FKG94_13150 [Exilibacterium tricleocarpae]
MSSRHPPAPGAPWFKPQTLAELFDHWRRAGRLYLPKEGGSPACLFVDMVVEARFADAHPIHGLVTARTADSALPSVLGVHYGNPPAVSYPLPLLVIKRLPGGPEDLYWHPYRVVRGGTERPQPLERWLLADGAPN